MTEGSHPEPHYKLPSQSEVTAAPMIFADAMIGVASAGGVARLTFGSLVFNSAANAQDPTLKPTVTLVVPEVALLAFAKEISDRAEMLGVTLNESEEK